MPSAVLYDALADHRTDPGVLHAVDFAVEMAKATLPAGAWKKMAAHQAPLWSNYTTIPGVLTAAVKWAGAGTQGGVTFPAHGLHPLRNVTYSCRVHVLANWASWVTGKTIWQIGKGDTLALEWHSATQLRVSWTQARGATTSTKQAVYAFPSGVGIPIAGTSFIADIAIKTDGTGTLALNGISAIRVGGSVFAFAGTVPPEATFESSGFFDGLVPLYDKVHGQRCLEAALEGFTALRGVRVQGQPIPDDATPANVLTVDPATAADPRIRLRSTHLGILSNSNAAPGWPAAVAGCVGLTRADKLLAASPIKRLGTGGAVDTANGFIAGPTPGSPWQIDPQVAYRDLDHLIAQVGAVGQIHFDLDAVPYNLCDPTGPRTMYYTGTLLSTRTSQSQPFVAAVPNSNGTNTGTIAAHNVQISDSTAQDWAFIAADLWSLLHARCVEIDFPFSRVRFGFWNEAETNGGYWNQTAYADPQAELMKLWVALVRTIQYSSTDWEAFTGLDIGSTSTFNGPWLKKALQAVKDASLPGQMDYRQFVARLQFHDYSGLFNTIEQALRTTDADRKTLGYQSPIPLYLGEGSWSPSLSPGQDDQYPAGVTTSAVADSAQGAAFNAGRFIEMAKAPYWAGTDAYYDGYALTAALESSPLGLPAGNPFGCSGLLRGTDLGVLPNRHVFSLLSNLCPDWPGAEGEARAHVQTSWDGVSGVYHLATHCATDETLWILFVSYRRFDVGGMQIRLPIDYAGRPVTVWAIDKSHSSRYDAGDAHADLEVVSLDDLYVSDDFVIPLYLAGMSVTLVKVAPFFAANASL